MSGVFVTGTDTNIGKTLVSAILCQACLLAKLPVAYWKPIQTGDDSDTATLLNLTSLSAADCIANSYNFKIPAAPYLAARAEQAEINLTTILTAWQQLPPRHRIVEGAGGVLVPLTATATIRDLIKLLQLPTLVVASTRLGTINHTLLTLEALQKAVIPIKGIILVGEADPELSHTLQHFSGTPVLTTLPWLPHITKTHLSQCAQDFFPAPLLEKIFYD